MQSNQNQTNRAFPTDMTAKTNLENPNLNDNNPTTRSSPQQEKARQAKQASHTKYIYSSFFILSLHFMFQPEVVAGCGRES
jgi:hypothetical protein